MRPVLLVKLGGSLITEKAREETARDADIARLAAEIAEAAASLPDQIVLGHGSGSFGHAAAHRSGIARGFRSPEQLHGIAETQASAAALHRRVVAALLEAGLSPFSLAPSSWVTTAGGAPAAWHGEPLLRALDLGLLPVVYGDVILDRGQGVAILSTEGVLELAAGHLLSEGRSIRRALWCGETDGLYDRLGATVPRLSADVEASEVEALGAPAGTDVTGGMRLRLETALRLARRGIPSLLLNGRTPGALLAALRGSAVAGTEIR